MSKQAKILIGIAILGIMAFLILGFTATQKFQNVTVMVQSDNERAAMVELQKNAYLHEALRLSQKNDSIQFQFIKLDNNCDSIVLMNKSHINALNKKLNETEHHRDSLNSVLHSLQRAN